MLLPSRERYSSSRTERSNFWASSSAPKLRPSCSTPRTICETPIINASGIKTLVSGVGLSMALNAFPVNTGTTAASPALPTAPIIIIVMIHQWRRTCDQIHRTGVVRSEICARCMENSAGAVIAIRLDSTTPPQTLLKDSNLGNIKYQNDYVILNDRRKGRIPDKLSFVAQFVGRLSLHGRA